VLVWSITTAFGVIAFAFFFAPASRRRNVGERHGPHPVSAVTVDRRDPRAIEPPAALVPTVSTATTVAPGPAHAPVPPWLRRGRDSDTPDTERVEAARFPEPPRPGASRYTIRYRWVRVSDGPDEPSSNEIGRLDRGDEVEVIGEHEGALRIRTPSGLEGWVPRFVIVG
jgi:hypothetical protein